MAKNNKQPKWKLSDEEMTDIVLPAFTNYHLVITDQMFQRVAKFAKTDDGIIYFVGEIIEKGVAVVNKILQRNNKWKVFQHLKPQIEDKNKSQVVMTKHNSKTKLRKHEKHDLFLRIHGDAFLMLKENHARINTFSMAVLARIIIEIFLDLYEKCGNYDQALRSLGEVIVALANPQKCEKCEAFFRIYIEKDENEVENDRPVVFFTLDIESASLGINYHFRLRL